MTSDSNERNQEFNSDLPEEASLAGEDAGSNPVQIQNDKAEEIRLAHEKDSHSREGYLFKYARWVIGLLFIFAACFAIFVVYAVSNHASPWLITLASICILTPAVLLACLFQHVYSKNNIDARIMNQLIDRAPVIELVKSVADWLQDLIKSKK